MTNLRKILIADDDVDFRTVLHDQLRMTEDYDVSDAGTGAEVLEMVARRSFNLILLDVELPDTDGRELCRILRRRSVNCPIIMLTAHATDSDIILGLEAGANDYVAKPFRLPVLLARMRAQLRQLDHSEGASLQMGPYVFQPAHRVLVDHANRRIRLTEKEANILKMLYRAPPGQAVPREALLDEIWGYNAGVTTHTLETHIYRLRQKIEPDPQNARLLITEAGGYRLSA